MHEARRSQWPPPLASRATKQTARRAPSLRVAAKCGVCVVALLGIVGSTTTFVARLASIRILPATQSAEDLIRGSFSFAFRVAAAPGLGLAQRGACARRNVLNKSLLSRQATKKGFIQNIPA